MPPTTNKAEQPQETAPVGEQGAWAAQAKLDARIAADEITAEGCYYTEPDGRRCIIWSLAGKGKCVSGIADSRTAVEHKILVQFYTQYWGERLPLIDWVGVSDAGA